MFMPSAHVLQIVIAPTSLEPPGTLASFPGSPFARGEENYGGEEPGNEATGTPL